MQYSTTWIELNSDAFAHNARLYKKALENTRLAFVLKSNAYGHGLLEMAALAQNNRSIDWLCLANLSDALTLRSQGITKPILVMSCIDTDPAQAVHKNIDIVVYNHETAALLNALGTQHGYTFHVQIKIDTGLSRLGIMHTDAIPFIKHVQTLPNLFISGIFSHFSESNDEDQSYTLLQAERFATVIAELEKEGIIIPICHLANSAGATTLSLPVCTMARVGAGLLGLWPSKITQQRTVALHGHFPLKPILTLKARITNLKKVPMGSFIGYARTFQAPRDMIIANVPLGYFEGYDFRLYNNASMRIHDQYARVVGRISMNLTTIDVTDIAQAKLGDEVIIMGDYPHITPYELNAIRGNPNVREIHTRLHPEIPRIVL